MPEEILKLGNKMKVIELEKGKAREPFKITDPELLTFLQSVDLVEHNGEDDPTAFWPHDCDTCVYGSPNFDSDGDLVGYSCSEFKEHYAFLSLQEYIEVRVEEKRLRDANS